MRSIPERNGETLGATGSTGSTRSLSMMPCPVWRGNADGAHAPSQGLWAYYVSTPKGIFQIITFTKPLTYSFA